MQEFLAEVGYTMSWGFGTPSLSFEEGYNLYLTFGIIEFAIFIIGVLLILSYFVSLMLEKRRKR